MGLGFRRLGFKVKVQHLKSTPSFQEQLSKVIEEYPQAHWVPQH